MFNPGEVLEAAVNSLKANKVYRIDKDNYRADIIQHLCRLSSEDRHMRFGVALPDARIEHYVDESLKPNDYLFGVFNDEGEMIGFLHLAHDARDKLAYEIGLSVDESARKSGIGGKLFEKAVIFAKGLGAKRVYTYCLSENKAMQHLARKSDLKVMLEYGDVTGELVVGDRTHAEILNGLVEIATSDQMMIFDRVSNDFITYTMSQYDIFMQKIKDFNKMMFPFQ